MASHACLIRGLGKCSPRLAELSTAGLRAAAPLRMLSQRALAERMQALPMVSMLVAAAADGSVASVHASSRATQSAVSDSVRFQSTAAAAAAAPARNVAPGAPPAAGGAASSTAPVAQAPSTRGMFGQQFSVGALQ